MTTTRRSKIARLPEKVRNELDERLEQGQAAEPLLQWLNALPATQNVLKYFDGQPISESNLSHWRQGGHQDWLADCRALELAERLSRQAQGAQKVSQGHLGEQLSLVLTLRVAGLMQKLLAVDEEKSSPEQQWQSAKELVREADRVRRSDLRAQHLKLQQERWEWDRERQNAQDEKAAEEEEKKFEIDKLTGAAALPHEIHMLTLHYGSKGKARYVAEKTHALKFNLPLPKLPESWDDEEEVETNDAGGQPEVRKAEPGKPKPEKQPKNGAPKAKGQKVKKPERNGHKEKRPHTKKTSRTRAATPKAERRKHKAEKQARNGAPSREPQAGEGPDADITTPEAQAEEPWANPPNAGPEGETEPGPEEAEAQEPDAAGPPV